MKSFQLLFAVTTLAFLFALPVSTATAGSMGNGAAQRMKLVIESIDVATGTVEFKSMVDNSTHTYKIDATTQIRVGTTKGTIDQIQAGQKVANYVLKPGPPPQTLQTIFVSQAVPAAAAPANK